MSKGQGSSGKLLVRARTVLIVVGSKASTAEEKAAKILAHRLEKRSSVSVSSCREEDLQQTLGGKDLAVVLGSRERSGLVGELLTSFKADLPRLPNSGKAHPEGFSVASGQIRGVPCVLVAGVDERGVIYGVGWFLRSIRFLDGCVEVPPLSACEKPAFWMRGGNPTGPGSRARQFGKLRPQTQEERLEMMEDLMLLGTNIFSGDPELVRSYGMMTTFGRTANEAPRGPDGKHTFPREWAADGGLSRQYICPSIPEARKALLDIFEDLFKNSPDYDFFTTNSGDSGGCRCERCMPWGATYIRLVHEIADILHKYHPNCKVLATNQDLTNEGNQAIFDYLNSGDSSWLFAIRYGPGADEMQTYIRGPVNPRWFEYEGFGRLGNFLKYMHHVLPRTTNIALYSDITHWMQSQFGVERPDVALAAVYGRRSWNARPRHFHKVAREIFHYALGDMHYSEGMHDDFNKWLWYRMLWNPHLEAEEITREYCRYWFGPDAEEEMTRAIFLMEETLEKPVLGNPGIPRAVRLLRSAREKIPPNLMRIDYRWRIIMQKALMDLYIQRKLERGERLKAEARRILEGSLGKGDLRQAVEEALKVLRRPLVTPSMRSIKKEAISIGEESNEIIGYRVPAPFIVDELDLTEVEWWRKTLGEALDKDESGLRNAVMMVLRYDDPGCGGFYDSPGWPSVSEHLVEGETLWGFMPFPGPAKLSHYNLAYSFGKERGVRFRYRGLDPQADYVVRISVGVHVPREEASVSLSNLGQVIEVNGVQVSEELPIPVGEIKYFEYEIPREAVGDGEAEIALRSTSKALPIVGLCEIWLMKKQEMPWTARL